MPRTTIPEEPGADGSYHAYVPTGQKRRNGGPERRHLQHRDREQLIENVLKLEALIDVGKTPPVGAKNLKAGDWFATWLKDHAPKRGGYNTLENRKWAVNTYLIPHLGGHLLRDLETSYIEDLYFRLYDEGLSPKSIELIHEALMLSLKKAASKKYLPENPAAAAERPEYEPEDIEPPTAQEITAILNTILQRRDRARWLTQFLGPRQGETLGLLVDDFELDEQIINVRGKLQRRTYEHGCDNPVACARNHCKTTPCRGPWDHGCMDPVICAKPHCNRRLYPSQRNRGDTSPACPPDCTGHARACPQRRPGKCRRHIGPCPPPCEPGCTKHALHCPERIGGLVITEPERSTRREIEHKEVARPKRTGGRRDTRRANKRLKPKTPAGKRRFGIPDPFVPLFIEHFEELERRAAAAGSQWRGIGLAFCGPLGQPIDPRADWDTWCQILEDAQVDHMPVHWIRHITASLLLAASVDGRIVMDIMGWTDPRMLQRYQHVADNLRRDAANRLANVLAIGGATASATATPAGVFARVLEKGPESRETPALRA
jgi:integrase